nr:uncharacterized protein LOC128685079 isoform X2 [Cherax quadricarinatus]
MLGQVVKRGAPNTAAMYRRIRSWVLDDHEQVIFRTFPVLKKVENVRLLDRFSNRKSTGTLYLTATHLIFVDPDAKKETWVSVAPASPQESCMNVLLQQGRCVNV